MKKMFAAIAAAAAIAAMSSMSPTASAQGVAALTATPSATRAVPHDTVTVTGTGTPGHRVALQRYVAKKWTNVATKQAIVSPSRTYTLTFPTNWYLSHKLRVRDTKTGQASRSFTVTVRPDYKPTGNAKSWKRLFAKGVRWNPCMPITWRYNPQGEYANALSDMKNAFAQISLGSGLTFKYLGTTNKAARSRRNTTHANIIVDWQTPAQNKQIRAGAVGVAYPLTARLPHRKTIILAGDFVLDQSSIARPEDHSGDLDAFNSGFFTSVATHELAHVVGLNHVGDKHQLMYPSAGLLNWRLGAGDLAGLKALGASQGCVPGMKR